MKTGHIMQFLKPDKRRISLFLIIPILLYLIIFTIGPLLSGPYVYLGIIPGAFLALALFPFALTASLLYAVGIDIFYVAGIVSKIGIISGIALTLLWWYILSCIIVSVFSRKKPKSAAVRT